MSIIDEKAYFNLDFFVIRLSLLTLINGWMLEILCGIICPRAANFIIHDRDENQIECYYPRETRVYPSLVSC